MLEPAASKGAEPAFLWAVQVTVDMKRMAEAFNTPVMELEKEP